MSECSFIDQNMHVLGCDAENESLCIAALHAVTLVLASLHWLPVNFRINFKILVKHGQALFLVL